MKLHITINSWF